MDTNWDVYEMSLKRYPIFYIQIYFWYCMSISEIVSFIVTYKFKANISMNTNRRLKRFKIATAWKVDNFRRT